MKILLDSKPRITKRARARARTREHHPTSHKIREMFLENSESFQNLTLTFGLVFLLFFLLNFAFRKGVPQISPLSPTLSSSFVPPSLRVLFWATKIAKKLSPQKKTHQHVCIVAAPRPTPALFFRARVHVARAQRHLQESDFAARERRRRRRCVYFYFALFLFAVCIVRAFWNFILYDDDACDPRE